MSYDIQEHCHRVSAWASSRAASARKGIRFQVKVGVAILEGAGFSQRFILDPSLTSATAMDQVHEKWRSDVIALAAEHGKTFNDGVAAKLINMYLKLRFVCGGADERPEVQVLHPPIDSLLLGRLAKINFAGHEADWRRLHRKGWSNFNADDYRSAIDLIRRSLGPGVPMWKIEEYWGGYQ